MTKPRSSWFLGYVFVVLANLDATVIGEDPDALIEQATAAAERGQHDEASRLATLAIEKDARATSAYYVRARERFRAGRIPEAVADFDKYVELRPEIEPRQWERGIALFYAGLFKKGAKQFELYQTFDGHDVENSVWRFLCMAPEVGVRRAQAVMLPIENDRRVPMMQVFELFRGKLKPEEVLAAARAGEPNDEALAGRLFYAHLYLGLWFEANGDGKQARRYIDLAADEKLKTNPRLNRYMWDVARIHQRLLRGELKRG